MAWLRFSDDWNRRPEIRALDDAGYRTLACLTEAAEHFSDCGTVPDDYVMTTYPHARQKLRNEIRKLADRGLVHLLTSPDDHDSGCASCQTRLAELPEEGAEELRKKWGTSATTSTKSRKTEPMYICIPHFFDVAMAPEAKREKRRQDAERQQRKRDRDKTAPSRRDAKPPSRTPVPVPVPQLKINDHAMAPKEPEPPSTASPSEPSDLVQWLIERLAERRKHVGCKPLGWKPEYQEPLEAVALKATQAEGDPFKILTGALDGFIADPSQRTYKFSPAGLARGFDTYAADVLEQEKAEASARKRAEQDKKLAVIDKRILEKEEREKAEKQRPREANGTSRVSAPLGNLGPDLKEWK